MRNCPDITIVNSCFIHGHIHGLGLHLGISHGVGHGVGYVLVMPHGVAHGVSHFQSSFRTNVSKVTICAQILKWQRFLTVIYWFLTVIHRFLTVILTRGRYRAARAAKNTITDGISTAMHSKVCGIGLDLTLDGINYMVLNSPPGAT